jgi:glycosyltransferase involved in cell wall biosynthesis
MKTSFVTTVLNEAKTITLLLDSLQTQTKLPDEVIIVDAGSTDQTLDLIKAHPLNQSVTVRIISQQGVNRSQGRNLGIKSANHQIIALSDAGCVLDSDWLARITEPFKSTSVDSVAGYYQTTTGSVLAKAMAPFAAVMPDRFNSKTYLPSSRSLALKKSAWLKVGQYPEKLDFCEDLIFSAKLKAHTRLVVRPEAIVFWQIEDSLKGFYHRLKNYASGDVLAGYWPHLIKIISVYLRYLVFFTAPPLFLAYLFWPIIKFNHYVSGFKAVACLPLVQLTADLAVMRGALLGLKLRLSRLF